MKSGLFEIAKGNMSADNFFITKVEVAPTHNGILDTLTFAVQDVIDITGQKTSCGNPTWLNQQPVSDKHAECVQQFY
jgi:Asp-tRNA(Asn)/Glu-tRNA(Gln) amidotransferase A subunit family amidase